MYIYYIYVICNIYNRHRWVADFKSLAHLLQGRQDGSFLLNSVFLVECRPPAQNVLGVGWGGSYGWTVDYSSLRRVTICAQEWKGARQVS